MNILFLTNHLNIGGITSYVLGLARGMKRRSHNVYIASCGGKVLGRFIEEGIIFIPVPIKTKQELSPKILVSMFKLSAAIKKNNIDILHSNSRTTQVLGCLLSRKTNVTHISTCHGFFKTRLFRRIFPCWGRKVVAISEAVREHLVRDFKVNPQDIKVIHNGIDIGRFRNQKPETRNQKKEALGLKQWPVVGIVARLSDVKGHIYLIEAMKKTLEKMPQAQLLIVGEGKMKETLVKLSESLGISKNVFFMPQVDDTYDVLSIMDLFVMPSLEEGLGLALMEAMAGGLAVVGSDVGGIKSLIQNGHNGLLVKAADVAGLSSAILELLQNPALREFLGNNARLFINQNFSQEKMVSRTEELYLECLNTKN